jgi:tetratricopeptide (TPR) repeat protein
MQKRWLIYSSLIILLLLAVFVWQLPAILKAIPSRYVARLPEPIQEIGVREHVEMLPTSVFQSDASELLQPVSESTEVAMPQQSAPPTPTPPPTFGPTVSESGPQETATEAEPSSTPEATATAEITATPTQVPVPETARLTGIDHRFQTWNNCGPATMSMALTYFDVYHTQDQTASVLKPDPEDRNVSPEEMAAYVRNQTDYEAISRANGDLYKLRRLLSNDIPVIIELGIDPPGDYAWMGWYGHYLLLVAYDDNSETVWVYDSWFGTSEVPGENADTQGREISYEELDQYWRHFNRNYIALYRPEQEEVVDEVIGAHMDDNAMWEDARQTVLRELNDEPENAFLWFNLGTVYNALGDYERAASAFDQARTIGLPWRMLWYQFGPYEAYYQVGRYDDVIVLADVTLQDRPYFEESFYYKGLAQAELGDVDEARRNLERAVNFNPNFTPAADALRELEVANK